MRLDKLLANTGYGSRKEVKAYIRKGLVLVNGNTVYDDDLKVDEQIDEISILDQKIEYQEKKYLILNKPDGYVSATFDFHDPTVLDLINEKQKGLFPVGRLDKDTTGLLLITNDGILAHKLLSPKNHVSKVYELTFIGRFKNEYYKCFKEGITLDDGYVCKPAIFELTGENSGKITIYEGKFHQVKRMMQALNMEVTSLKRISFGNLNLPSNLECGKYRELTIEELETLKK